MRFDSSFITRSLPLLLPDTALTRDLQRIIDREEFARAFVKDRFGNPWGCRDYQKKSLRSCATRKVHRDGRDVGKTSEIEIAVAWASMALPHREMLVAAQCENHLFPLMERIWRRFESVPQLSGLLVERKRQPSYFLRFANGFTLWGRIAGPRGINFQGLHVDWQIVDEAQELTEPAWGELYQALNSGGWRWVYGVPNGLRGTYYRMTRMPEYAQFRWPSHLNPDFTEEKRQELIRLYGGEDSEGYIHRVLGEHGSPARAALNFDDYLICVDESLKFQNIHITRRDAQKFNLEEMLPEPDSSLSGLDIYMGCDLGYTRDPTELVLYCDDGRIMTNFARVHMQGVDYHTQQRTIEILDKRFSFRGIGIDKGNNGMAVCHNLLAIGDRWTAIVHGYDFGSRILVGYNALDAEDRRQAKRFMTQLIEERLRERTVSFPKLAERDEQYVSHTYRLGPTGQIVYEKGNDHIIDADRCAMLRQYLEHVPVEPTAPEDPGVRFEPFN
jgi:hypothetical protein